MKPNFRMPSITAPTIPGQIQQIHSFLRQLVEELQRAVVSRSEASVQVFRVTPYSSGIGVKNQACRCFGDIGMVHGQVTIEVPPGYKKSEPFAVLQIPKAYAPKVSVAASAAAYGGGMCGCYILGQNTNAPGMVQLYGADSGETMISFAYSKEM